MHLTTTLKYSVGHLFCFVFPPYLPECAPQAVKKKKKKA